MNKKQISSGIWRMSENLRRVDDELMENGGELTPELEELLALNEENQVSIVDGLHELIAKQKMEETYISDEIKRLQALKKTRANAIDRLKTFLLDYMRFSGIKRIEGQLCKVSIAGKSGVVVDEEALLEHYGEQISQAQENLPPYITLEPKINKTAAKAALENGYPIPTYKDVDVAMVRPSMSEYLLIK